MKLGEVKVDSYAEERCRHQRCLACGSITHRPSRCRAHERRQREYRAGAASTDPALSKEIESQAQTISRGAADKKAERSRALRERLIEPQRRDEAETRAESTLPPNHLSWIQLRERTSDRVIESPRERREQYAEGPPIEPPAPAAAVEGETDSCRAHDRDGDRHASTDVFAIEEATEQHGKHSLEVEEQRRRGCTCVLKSPNEGDGSADSAEKGDHDDPAKMGGSHRSFTSVLRPSSAEAEGGTCRAGVEKRDDRKSTSALTESLNDRCGDSEGHSGQDGEQAADGDGVACSEDGHDERQR